ncbi:Phosphomethylpyrimidine synthase [Sedimentisphaera cyanobacteriorum]|uniref:Phosphomethylpyrimidine synthase n=1 Tax=Sedimentisphaera cyanobacteriorum TaxID=1940790 RepID=A0A1Q2HM80_9BACT|nr:phosphomethylpyrimidine synthase ThiC [Sedimentisphaera cyanobacteriorum]AQQ08577.1 Phosphomethylpyrimidine synthase [Sedimentisphaera cyanobacteriorum]
MLTQLEAAKKAEITSVVENAAEYEGLSPELLRDEIAAGRLVVPANVMHLSWNLTPRAIGRKVSTKVNANIGMSDVRSSIEDEKAKMAVAVDAGADAVMDLSTGGDLDYVRSELISACPLPFGTVPVYEAITGRNVEDITPDLILEIVEKQAKQGVDFFTIHAGLLREHLPLLKSRVCGIVSRGGALTAKWMLHHNRQNLMYDLFDDLCDIMHEYDVCFSLGDGLRPGCGADATDDAQIAELRTLGELTQRAWERGCQVMVEGPGHVPFNQIEENMRLQQEICKDAPFYVLGPLVTDIAPGYDHITSAIGGTAAAYYGASFLCYVTPREHLGLPDNEDVRQGVVASKIAAHSADVARGHNDSAERDRRLSKARADLDWDTQIRLSLDPKTAKRMKDDASKNSAMSQEQADYCTMCGRDWCSVRINREIRDNL